MYTVPHTSSLYFVYGEEVDFDLEVLNTFLIIYKVMQ
jgi:hypothetical protein